MLVLSRKKNDSIVIDGNITIEVVQIKGNQVRLGIKAPRHVRILRGELTPYESPADFDDAEAEYLCSAPLAVVRAS